MINKNNIGEEKERLRTILTAQRKMLADQERHIASEAITRACLSLPEVQTSSCLCVYQSFPSEVDTTLIIEECLRQKKRVIVPESLEAKLAMCFIVPGVAFDRSGHRLGRGGGYYDKLLSGVAAPKIALAFSFQLLTMLPCESHDIVMDIIVTEQEIIRIKEEL